MTKKDKTSNNQRIFRWGKDIIVLLLITLSLFMCNSCRKQQDNEILIPDLAPQETESNIEMIPNDTDPQPDNTSGGAVRLLYSDQITINLSEAVASIYFGTPRRSNQDMILQITIQDKVIAQSELIPAGYQIMNLSLLPDVVPLLQPGMYSGKFVVYYYDQVTDKLAAVNTEIPVNITVSK